jgi:hypothetical protein
MPPLIREVDPTKKTARIDPGPYVNILQIIDKKYPLKERGDVLVFLNGEHDFVGQSANFHFYSGISEITIVADAFKEYAEFTKRWIVLILHRFNFAIPDTGLIFNPFSTLSVEEQQKVKISENMLFNFLL